MITMFLLSDIFIS